MPREDWTEYTGRTDTLPHPETVVHVRFRDGEETRAAEPVKYWGPNWYWDRRFPGDSEIVAYRVVAP